MERRPILLEKIEDRAGTVFEVLSTGHWVFSDKVSSVGEGQVAGLFLGDVFVVNGFFKYHQQFFPSGFGGRECQEEGRTAQLPEHSHSILLVLFPESRAVANFFQHMIT